MKTEKVLLSQVKVNKANPRTITQEKLHLLVERLLVFPKMIQLRPVVVDNTMTALGGNMRWLWNNPQDGQSPYKMFEGVMQPEGKDENGDLIYVYHKERTI